MAGNVVSAVSSVPVVGAVVKFEISDGEAVVAAGEVVAAADGTFALPAKTFWGAHGVESPVMGPRGKGTIEVTAKGFESQSRELRWWTSGPSTLKFGVVQLSPTPETPNTSFERTRGE